MRTLFAAILATTVLASGNVSAHTKAIGYHNAGAGSVTFWYQSWHSCVPPFLEGSFNLVGINGNPYPSTTVPFTLSTCTKPPLLVDGVNNFFACNRLPNSFCPTDEDAMGGTKWQGVTMNNLTPGEYRFTYIPIANPTADWQPATEGVRSNTFILTAATVGGCFTPPSGMVAWWPLDEATAAPPTAHEIIASRDGTQSGVAFNAGNFIAGEVNGAYRLSSLVNPYNYVQVPDYSTFDFTTSFTIDAWIRQTSNPTPGNARYIVSKATGNGFQLTGYQFFLDDTNRLGFEMGTNNLSQNDDFHNLQTGTPLALNTWYHVAVVVNRGVNPPTSQLYVNGAVVSPPFSHVGVTSIVNTSFLRIGSCTLSTCPFRGDIDEVEMFCRGLAQTEIASIYSAGSAGKCKISCKLPGTVGFCPHDNTEPATLTLCNNTASQQTFTWSVAGLPAAGACNINGPINYSPSGASVVVPPFKCIPPPPNTITITKPLNLAAGTRGCYKATATVPGFGSVFCSGGVVPELNNNLCCHPVGDTLRRIPVGTTSQILFTCSNAGGGSVTLNYEAREVPASNDPTFLVLRLNGLPPGTSVQQSVVIPGNGSVNIPIDVGPTKAIRYVDHDVLFSGTIDASPATGLTSVNIETETVDVEMCGTCDDGNGCTSDTCRSAGQCSYAAIDCNDGQVCTSDACDPTGVCTHTPSGPAPDEVDGGLRVAKIGDHIRISWNVAAGSTTSDLVRGLLSALPVGPGGGDELCVSAGFVGGSATDDIVPSVGAGCWYLVRGGSDCGKGPWGYQGLHGSPSSPRLTTSCP